jgi:hypothetical protein
LLCWLNEGRRAGGGAFRVLCIDDRVPTPSPPSSIRIEDRKKSNERGIIQPPSPHWDRRVMQPNHIKFRTCGALAPKRKC